MARDGGGRIPVKRTVVTYTSSYADEYGDNGMYASTTPIIVRRTIDSDGIYVMIQ